MRGAVLSAGGRATGSLESGLSGGALDCPVEGGALVGELDWDCGEGGDRVVRGNLRTELLDPRLGEEVAVLLLLVLLLAVNVCERHFERILVCYLEPVAWDQTGDQHPGSNEQRLTGSHSEGAWQTDDRIQPVAGSSMPITGVG